MTAAVDTERPWNAEPYYWDHPEEWEAGDPIYIEYTGSMSSVNHLFEAFRELREDHQEDAHDPRCGTCGDRSGWRWSPRRAVEPEWRGMCPMEERFTEFYGAQPVSRRVRAERPDRRVSL
jgi:hypothetical protein